MQICMLQYYLRAWMKLYNNAKELNSPLLLKTKLFLQLEARTLHC